MSGKSPPRHIHKTVRAHLDNMTRDLKILTTYWFLAGLILLLLNDFVLKGLHGNWLTGKLSDFAGLFIFPLFWAALLPKHKNKIYWLAGLFFIYWKSQYSQTLIDAWNGLSPLTISRVIDHSDLIALTILPFAYYIETIKEKLQTFRLTPLIPLIISVFAFIATSEAPQECFENDSATYHVKHNSRDNLIEDLKQSGLNIRFSKYHNTKYDDEHSEIWNLNDSIQNLVVLIRDFNDNDSTVEISLGCWDIVNRQSSEKIDKETLNKEKEYVKRTFELEVIKKIEKNAP